MRADDCLSDEQLAGWPEASKDDVAAMSAHVARCASCRELLAEVARTSGERPPPKTVGRYLLREKLGAGGMGTVWAAHDSSVDRLVAVKVLHESQGDGAHRTQRFLHERQVLAGLEHPHIARLLDAGETDDGRPWFAMDLVDGQPLDAWCDGRRLTVRQRLELMLPVLAAVSHAHQHLVVHRDLKPGNILVDSRGAPRLVDFGLARLLEGPGAGLTQTGMTPMTPAYASPEQVRRESAATPSDVFSLGVVLYELLSGVSPWAVDGNDVDALLRAIRDAEPQPPSAAVDRAPDDAVHQRGTTRARLRRELAADVDAIVLMALRKEPKDRYPSVQALADDVRAALSGQPTVARRGNAAYRASRFVRRHKVLVSALAVGFFALAVGLAATLWQARRAEKERDLAQRRFEQVRRLARSVLFDYHDALVALPGSTALRARMVDDARSYLDALSSEAQGDLVLKKELARAWLRLGDAQGEATAGSLGKLAEARQSYQRAKAQLDSVLAAAPGDVEARQVLVGCHEKLGDNLSQQTALPEALAEYDKARALAQALAVERPDDQEGQLGLARVDIRAADVLRQLGKLDEAAAAYQRAITVLSPAVKARPQAALLRNLGISHRMLAVVQQDQGKLQDALASAKEAERLFEELVKQKPDDVEARRVLSTVWGALLSLYNLLGDQPNAVRYARKDLELARSLVKADPANATARRDLMASLVNLVIGLGLGEKTEAPALEKEVLALQRAQCAEAPDNLRWRADLVQVLSIVALAETERAHPAEAERLFAELFEVAATLPPSGPDAVTTREVSNTAHLGLSGVRASQGRFQDALAENKQALVGFEALLTEHPDLGRIRNLWAMTLSNEGQVLMQWAEQSPPASRAARWQAAIEALERALAAIAKVEEKGTAMVALDESRQEVTAALEKSRKALAKQR
ncbi:MAG: protein kinase [Myxococcales bacterium]|nr:protein kinase [Myxococcales bacterium]